MDLSDTKEVAVRFNKARSTVYRWLDDGLLPPRVQWGWPNTELDTIEQAMVAGFDEDGIRQIVRRIVANRADTQAQFLAELG